ncbi:MAG: GIN domain-containing protein, partial [Casimicrobiaceae bacterium]
MNRALLPLMIAVCVAIAAGLAWFTLNRQTASQSVPAATRSMVLPPFHRITIDGIANVTLVQGTREAVEVDVPAGSRGVRARVSDGTLAVSASERPQAWAWMFGTRERSRATRIVILYRSIDRLGLSGAVKVAAGTLRADGLAIDASG